MPPAGRPHLAPRLASLEFEIQGTPSTRDAAGARVTVTTGATAQIRDVRRSAPGGARQPHRVHFGLGTAPATPAITVRWLGAAAETFTGISPEGRYKLVQRNGRRRPGAVT